MKARNPASVARIRRAADRLERKLARLKATLVPADLVTRRLAEIEIFGAQRFAELLAEAATALAEAQTVAGRLQILEAIARQVVAELDAKEPEFKQLPTLADIEKQRLN